MLSLRLFLLLSIIFLSFILRFYKLESIPPGLYIDEASVGVNAHSILTTGRDEYGKRFPLWFTSLGDYKLPAYIYLTSVSVLVFGKSEFAVRFPSALVGSLTVILLYFLILEISTRRKLALLSSFFLGISPWHLQFSRVAFEANLALFLFVAGSLCTVLFWKNQKSLLFFTAIALYSLTIQTYNSYRIIAPTAIIILFWKAWESFPKMRKHVVSVAIFLLVVNLPAIMFFLTPEGSARFSQTSAFSGESGNTIVETFSYLVIFLRNYISYFSVNFLFGTGDGIARHQMVGFSPLPRLHLFFIIVGIALLLKQNVGRLKQLLFSFLLLSPVPAALTLPSPQALRSELSVVPYVILAAIGLLSLRFLVKKRFAWVALLITVFSVYELTFYFHFYYHHYPNTSLMDWGGGFKQVVEKTAAYSNRYPLIAVDKRLGFPYIYFLFYNDNLKPIFVDVTWRKPLEFSQKTVLYISIPIDENSNKPSNTLIDEIRLPNPNRNVFAQFWEI